MAPFQNPCRAFSFIDRMTCLAFSFDWYSSNKAMTLRIIAWTGSLSSPTGWVMEIDPDAVLGELAEIKLLFEGLAEKAAVAVHDDDVERVLAIAGALDHLLEDGPAIVGRRTLPASTNSATTSYP